MATPQRVIGEQKLVNLVGTRTLSCGLTALGELYCWGETKDWVYSPGTPKRLFPDFAFKSVPTSVDPMCGVAVGGAGYCWGRGYLGDGYPGRHSAPQPVPVGAPQAWNEIVVASDDDMFAATPALEVFAWGRDWTELSLTTNYRHYGIEHEGHLTVPTLVPLISGLSDLAATFHGRCGLTDGAAVCWGDFGAQLAAPPGPFTVAPPNGRFTVLAAGGSEMWALAFSGEIYAWGGGRPLARLSGRGPWTAIGKGTADDSVCGILAADSTVYCWDFTDAVHWGAVLPRPVPRPDAP